MSDTNSAEFELEKEPAFWRPATFKKKICLGGIEVGSVQYVPQAENLLKAVDPEEGAEVAVVSI